MTLEIEIAGRDELAARFAARWSAAARAATAARGRATLALAGGSATEAFVPAWPHADVDWSRVELFWVDERAVAADDAASNYGLARRSGLERLPLAPERVHRLRGEAEDLAAAAAAGDRELRAALAGGPVDVALVGVGEDGHLASLFAGHPALAVRARWVVAVTDAPKPPPRRLTWTLHAFARVDLLVVAAFGAAKAEAVAAAAAPAGSPLPIARAAALARRRLLLVDAAAATRLAPTLST